MRARSLAVLIASSAAIPAAVAAKGPPPSPPGLAAQVQTALNAMVQPLVAPPGQSSRPADPDQGDDHAAARAIEMVCTKDTPAAQRSAICPVPISPD
jgi:hypothetical protein